MSLCQLLLAIIWLLVCLVIFFFFFLFCDSPVLSDEPWNFEVSVKSELEDKECKTVSFFPLLTQLNFTKCCQLACVVIQCIAIIKKHTH